MKTRCSKPLLLIPFGVALLFVPSEPARAQKGMHSGMGHPHLSHSPKNPGRIGKPGSNAPPAGIQDRSPAGNALAGQQQIEKLSMMSPEQRQKALASLPPERQKHLEKGLENWQKMTPEQRQNAKARLEKLQSLPPEEQQQVRQAAQAFQQLPDDRKRSINQEMGQLRKMTPQQRDERLSAPDFKNKFSAAEQEIVKRRLEVLPESSASQE